MADEFDTVAGWTERGGRRARAGPREPAACRGSGSPSALDWLAERLRGRGGPPAARRRRRSGRTGRLAGRARRGAPGWPSHGGALRAARRLFGLPVVVAAAGAAVPRRHLRRRLEPRRARAPTEDKAALLAELRRVLGPAAGSACSRSSPTARCRRRCPRATTSAPRPSSTTCSLPPASGFCRPRRHGSPADAPVSWRARADRVEDALARRHGGDPRWEIAQEQTARMARLISGGRLRPTLLHAVAV